MIIFLLLFYIVLRIVYSLQLNVAVERPRDSPRVKTRAERFKIDDDAASESSAFAVSNRGAIFIRDVVTAHERVHQSRSRRQNARGSGTSGTHFGMRSRADGPPCTFHTERFSNYYSRRRRIARWNVSSRAYWAEVDSGLSARNARTGTSRCALRERSVATGERASKST